MGTRIISLMMLLAGALPVYGAAPAQIRADAPDQYTVQRGDTLWGISGRFLNQPWRWPELWRMNQEQIRNPHLIYPGDVIVLDRSGAEAQLRLRKMETVKLSPQIRVEPLARAVPSISPAAIAPFLSKPLLVGQNELDAAARIIATPESRVAVGAGEVERLLAMSGDAVRAVRAAGYREVVIDPRGYRTGGARLPILEA